jgi:flagellar biosynthetic protein FlhB
MAEESSQEKTEEATPKRREEARNKGQVARSSELSSVAILMSGVLALGGLGSYMYSKLSFFMVDVLSNAVFIELTPINIAGVLETWFNHYVLIVGPLIVLLVLAALLVNYAQVGILFTADPLIPKANRISPLTGIKRIFSSKGLVELLKGLFKIAAVAIMTYFTVKAELKSVVSYMDLGVGQIFLSSGNLILTLFFRIVLLLLIMALLDYVFQRWDYEKNLRMTRQQIKEEFKQQEGDPLVSARVRNLQREMSRKRMMDDVAKADVIITNPTHVAVALKYDIENMQAPLVLAKGQRLVAERIKDLGRQVGIPLVENKPLARALFKAVHIGDEIPEDLFKAVAQVLAFVFQLKRRDLK